MPINLSQGDFNEEDMVYQLIEDMELGNQDSILSNFGMERISTTMFFTKFNVFQS